VKPPASTTAVMFPDQWQMFLKNVMAHIFSLEANIEVCSSTIGSSSTTLVCGCGVVGLDSTIHTTHS
jgi:hypothetical protein